MAACVHTPRDAWWTRPVMHPKMRMSMADARVMSIREAIITHAILDTIDEALQNEADKVTPTKGDN